MLRIAELGAMRAPFSKCVPPPRVPCGLREKPPYRTGVPRRARKGRKRRKGRREAYRILREASPSRKRRVARRGSDGGPSQCRGEQECSRSADTLRRHTPQTRSADTLRRHAPQTHSADTLRRHAPQTHSADTLRRHTPQTHSADTLRRHTPQTRSADTLRRHTPQTHSANTPCERAQRTRCRGRSNGRSGRLTSRPKLASPFQPGHGYALDEGPLREEEHHDHRRDHRRRCGHKQMPLRAAVL